MWGARCEGAGQRGEVGVAPPSSLTPHSIRRIRYPTISHTIGLNSRGSNTPEMEEGTGGRKGSKVKKRTRSGVKINWSAQWEKPAWGAEPGIELGSVLQQVDALPPELRCTQEFRRTLMSYVAPYELCRTLKLRRILWFTSHPQLRRSIHYWCNLLLRFTVQYCSLFSDIIVYRISASAGDWRLLSDHNARTRQ